jgi:3-oxoacyl-[acyl-carrier protein] reductase
MGMLDGQDAVVTGGSRSIGRAIVARLAADGARVAFSFARSAQDAAAVEQAAADAGGQARGFPADFTDPGAAGRLMAMADEYLGGLDILVNNAFLEYPRRRIADTSAETYDAVMVVNARAPFLTIRHAAAAMRDGGRIINISTLNTIRASPQIAAYAASKGALEQLTKVAALELGRRGITVNAVAPGATDTAALRHAHPADTLAEVARRTPLGRLGEAADIADVVAFLAGPDARWITGQIIPATGGLA